VHTRQVPKSDSVRLELQADCSAGVRAAHAAEPGPNGEPALVSSISRQDIAAALQVAARIGDDWIQKNLGTGQVNQNMFTHGTPVQREKWFRSGCRTGDPKACDTFATDNLPRVRRNRFAPTRHRRAWPATRVDAVPGGLGRLPRRSTGYPMPWYRMSPAKGERMTGRLRRHPLTADRYSGNWQEIERPATPFRTIVVRPSLYSRGYEFGGGVRRG
jgi:hypothetical protein